MKPHSRRSERSKAKPPVQISARNCSSPNFNWERHHRNARTQPRKRDPLTVVLTACYCSCCNTYFAIRIFVKMFAPILSSNYSWRARIDVYCERVQAPYTELDRSGKPLGPVNGISTSRKASPWACPSRLTGFRITRLREAVAGSGHMLAHLLGDDGAPVGAFSNTNSWIG